MKQTLLLSIGGSQMTAKIRTVFARLLSSLGPTLMVFAAFCIGRFMPTNSVAAAVPGRVITRELILLNEDNQTAAGLTSRNGETKISFFDRHSRKAVEIGIGAMDSRYVRFFGPRGTMVAALNSLAPNGETTLYIGDQRWTSRIILGALQTDTDDGGAPVNDWGFEFRKPGSSQNLFNIVIKHTEGDQVTAGMRLVRADGTIWTK